MKDLLLNQNGDLLLDSNGDIQFTDSISQAINIRIRWFAKEWRLGPDLGIPYYDEMFIKNPSYELIEEKMREAIMDVEEVEDVASFSMSMDTNLRKLVVTYVVSVGEKFIEGSVKIDV